MSNCDSFKSKVTGKEYKINYLFNCDSSNVVYLLECNVCGVQYVGSTNTPFRLRFNNYKQGRREPRRAPGQLELTGPLSPPIFETWVTFPHDSEQLFVLEF